MAHVDLGGLWHEAAFRLVETHDVEVERGWRIALDPQPYGEVVRVLSGRCRFALGNEHRDVGPGGIGILLPGPARLTADLGEGPLRFRGFGFRVQLFGAVELSGLLGLPLAIPHPWPDLDDRLSEVVRYGAAGDPADAFRARATAELVIASLVDRVGDVRAPGRAVRTEVATALAIMDEDPARDLDLATLAGAVNLSPKHFARCFKNVVGVPPMTYLQALRVSRAREALAASDRSVARVASSLGFADAAHLSRAFRKAYGTTPTDFRSRARALETSPVGARRRSSTSISRPLAG